jgi:signal transduction histidine kinase/ActR/RegA family two-component response regulator
MTEANKPANTPSPRVIKQHPSGKTLPLSDSEQVAATGNEDPGVLPGDSLVPLESVLCTEELHRRPSRPPDYEKESHALTALAQALADSPRTILQQLAEAILEIVQSDSAGISLLTTDDGGKRFYWPAIAGVWKPHIGGGTPRDFGPCGDVLDRNAPLLFKHFERRYAYFLAVTPPVEECLLVPFYVGGRAVGTIWAIAHNDRRKFDAEDMRQLLSLGKFASSAYQAVALWVGLEQRVAELQQANVELQASRLTSLNLMDDAIQSRQVTENVNEELRQAEGSRSVLATEMREANANLVVTAIHAHTRTEDAVQANQLKDEFLATVSHELRTPLNAVLGWARMLGSQQLPPDRAGHAIATIERNALALAHLIDDLLDVSRIVAGTLHLAPQPVDLVAVVQAALDAVQPLAAAKNVHLAFSPAVPAIETVSGDAGRLQQVIGNLLANAIKFTQAGGRVGVFIEPSNNCVEVRVVDSGQGISPEFLPHVFERFRQAPDATTRRHTGLGLGLEIVRKLVELHGGTVHAVSDGVGRGATFIVRLPISAGEARRGQTVALGERRTTASAASPMPRLPRLDGLHILVVDDDPDGRTLTSLVLTQAGASVKAVASVREAHQTLEVERPDALVSDLGLPDEDGYALIRHIRQHEAEHGGFLPAVALTGYARAEDRAGVLAAGFQTHLAKPVDPADLTAAIATMVQQPSNSDS